MRRIMSFGSAAALALTFATVVTAGADKTFPIKLTREVKPGLKARVHFKARQEQTLTAEGRQKKELGSERLGVELEAVGEVQKVDREGHPTQISYVIDSCYVTANGRREEIAPKGSILLAKRAVDKTIYTVDTQPV